MGGEQFVEGITASFTAGQSHGAMDAGCRAIERRYGHFKQKPRESGPVVFRLHPRGHNSVVELCCRDARDQNLSDAASG
jgi:hypothetical protein